MSKKFKVPEPVKKNIRCPLCYSVFAMRIMPDRIKDFLLCGKCNTATEVLTDTMNVCPQCGEARESHHEEGIALVCDFCKIGIMANDPFVDKWDAAYAKGDPVMCDFCVTKMRFFCNSTGLSICDCPNKKCRARMKTTIPDRREGNPLFDEKGEPMMLPGVSTPIATPDNMAPTQVADDPDKPVEKPTRIDLLQ